MDCLLVVFKTEPEETEPVHTGGVPAQRYEDVVPAQGDEYGSENEDHHSLHELEDVVVIKTEPDLLRVTCKFDHENHQEEPHLPPLCKTDPDSVEIPYSGGDLQTKIHMWSAHHIELPEQAGGHEDLNTSMLHPFVNLSSQDTIK